MAGERQANNDIALDLSGLFGAEAIEQPHAEAPQSEEKGAAYTNYSAAPKKPTEGRTEGLERATSQKLVFDNTQAEQQYKIALEIERKYQQNMARAAGIQKELCNSLRCGADMTFLFLKAVELIGLLTNDNEYRPQMERTIIQLYGYDLGDKQGLELELELTKARLAQLQSAAAEATGEREQRLAKAIEGHKQKVQELEAKLEQGK